MASALKENPSLYTQDVQKQSIALNSTRYNLNVFKNLKVELLTINK